MTPAAMVGIVLSLLASFELGLIVASYRRPPEPQGKLTPGWRPRR